MKNNELKNWSLGIFTALLATSLLVRTGEGGKREGIQI